MFGYVFPLKDELKVKEYEIFKGYYCGLCRTMGNNIPFSNLILTYDMAFLAILLSSLYNESEEVIGGFCPYKLKKIGIIKSNEFLNYAAFMNIFLSGRKFRDDYRDDRNYLALIGSKILFPREINDDIKEKLNKIDGYLNEINRLEDTKCSNLDEVSHYFALITEEIFDYRRDNISIILRRLGYNIGKWIYTIDAYDDLYRDIKENKYNPLTYHFGYSNEEPFVFKERIKESVKFTLFMCLSEASKAFEELNFKKNRGILENIIYLGLHHKTNLVLEGGSKNEKSLRGIRFKGWGINRGNKTSL